MTRERVNEAQYYAALKRITKYMTPAQLQSKAEKMYGCTYEEALEMAYENVIEEAKRAVRGKRAPKELTTASKEGEG